MISVLSFGYLYWSSIYIYIFHNPDLKWNIVQQCTKRYLTATTGRPGCLKMIPRNQVCQSCSSPPGGRPMVSHHPSQAVMQFSTLGDQSPSTIPANQSCRTLCSAGNLLLPVSTCLPNCDLARWLCDFRNRYIWVEYWNWPGLENISYISVI